MRLFINLFFCLLVIIFLVFPKTSFACDPTKSDVDCPPNSACSTSTQQCTRADGTTVPDVAAPAQATNQTSSTHVIKPTEIKLVPNSSCQTRGYDNKNCPIQTVCNNDYVCQYVNCTPGSKECGENGICPATGYCEPMGCSSDNDCHLATCDQNTHACVPSNAATTNVVPESCDTDPRKCSSSAGQICNSNNGEVAKDEDQVKYLESNGILGVKTAIGCIPTDPLKLINSLLGFSLAKV